MQGIHDRGSGWNPGLVCAENPDTNQSLPDRGLGWNPGLVCAGNPDTNQSLPDRGSGWNPGLVCAGNPDTNQSLPDRGSGWNPGLVCAGNPDTNQVHSLQVQHLKLWSLSIHHQIIKHNSSSPLVVLYQVLPNQEPDKAPVGAYSLCRLNAPIYFC